MTRSEQPRQTARTPARRTRAPLPPSTEDPPLLESCRPHPPHAARKTQSNQAAELNFGDDALNSAWKTCYQDTLRMASTVADAEKGIKKSKRTIRELKKDKPYGRTTMLKIAASRCLVKFLRQRREELRAAEGTASGVDDDPVDSDKGKGGATDQSVSAPRRSPGNAGALAVGSGGQDGRASQTTPENQVPATTGTKDDGRSSPTWKHIPGKWWEVRGITDEKTREYKIAWKGVAEDGRAWKDSWQRKYNVNAKARRDWTRRKGNPALREVVDGNTTDEDERVK